ncbi:MAG: hypothetical protein ABI480_05390 [Chitinophagaceae bacterium]
METESKFQGLAKPGQRALANAGITSLKKLSTFSEKEIAELHGLGKNGIIILKKELKASGLSFARK